MDKYNEDLKHIRSMMERSSTFLSLSGLSGVLAGVIALIGVFFVFQLLESNNIDYFDGKPNYYSWSVLKKLILIGAVTLACALAVGVIFTVRKAKKNNLPLWSPTTKQVLIHLFLPLLVGGIYSLILIFKHNFYLVAPSMLIFYGLALLNTSKYTLPEVFWLAIMEVILGLMACIWIGYGLVFWAIGFGVLHIVYGILLYNKYDK